MNLICELCENSRDKSEFTKAFGTDKDRVCDVCLYGVKGPGVLLKPKEDNK